MSAVAEGVAEGLRVSAFQQRVLGVPEQYDLFLGGGRGGGKDYAIALLILRHVEQYASRARVLYLRQSYKGLADFELVLREVFTPAYGQGARYNSQDHVWRFPNGAYLELGQLESHADYGKYQGRSFSMLVVSEAGQYATPDLLDLMRSNLRAPRDIPLRMIIAANPAGVGHFWLASRFVFGEGRKPWIPFLEQKSKREWIHAPSTFVDNEFIDQQQYRDQLESSAPSDPELLRAWLLGDWAVARGAYFASVLSESRNACGPFKIGTLPQTHGKVWDTWIAHDFGSSAPSVTLLMAESPGAEFEGVFYPRNSVVVLDEYAVHARDNLNRGLNWTAAITAEAIAEWCREWKVEAEGVGDDAMFSRSGHSNATGQPTSIADEFGAKGVTLHPAKKGDRISGWQRMRRMLADAGSVDLPGLFISRSCSYFWSTVPYLARDQKRIEDVDSSGADHAADAARYGLLRQKHTTTITPFWG